MITKIKKSAEGLVKIMLITKEVEIVLSSINIGHFENLGYVIPRYMNNKNKLVVKRGTTIIVKIEDLLDGSDAMVECLCD